MTNFQMDWGTMLEGLKLLGIGTLIVESLKWMLGRVSQRNADSVQLSIRRMDGEGELRDDLRGLWENCCRDLEQCRRDRERYRTAYALALGLLDGLFLRINTIATMRAENQGQWEFGLRELELQAAKGLPDIMAAVDAQA
jgi:hypothetical protein